MAKEFCDEKSFVKKKTIIENKFVNIMMKKNKTIMKKNCDKSYNCDKTKKNKVVTKLYTQNVIKVKTHCEHFGPTRRQDTFPIVGNGQK